MGGRPQKPQRRGRAEDNPAAKDLQLRELALLNTFVLLGRVVDRFGAPATLLFLMLLGVWTFGDATTQNDFARAVLFGERGWALPIAVSIMSCDLLFGFKLRRRLFRGESKEVDRLVTERNRLQERLLGKQLHHTSDDGINRDD